MKKIVMKMKTNYIRSNIGDKARKEIEEEMRQDELKKKAKNEKE